MRGIPSLVTDIRKAVFTEVAKMAYLSKTMNAEPANEFIQHKHYFRKHGANAYYGQK